MTSRLSTAGRTHMRSLQASSTRVRLLLDARSPHTVERMFATLATLPLQDLASKVMSGRLSRPRPAKADFLADCFAADCLAADVTDRRH